MSRGPTYVALFWPLYLAVKLLAEARSPPCVRGALQEAWPPPAIDHKSGEGARRPQVAQDQDAVLKAFCQPSFLQGGDTPAAQICYSVPTQRHLRLSLFKSKQHPSLQPITLHLQHTSLCLSTQHDPACGLKPKDSNVWSISHSTVWQHRRNERHGLSALLEGPHHD